MERHARETNVQEKSERVAVLVAGSFNRYFLVSSAERLVAPLRKQGYIVDYFLSLTTEAAKPYRAELGYTQYATWDPVFSNGARTGFQITLRLQQPFKISWWFERERGCGTSAYLDIWTWKKIRVFGSDTAEPQSSTRGKTSI
jgi:hypothetical protein